MVVPPEPETGRLVQTNVGSFVLRERGVPAPPAGAAPGSGQPPRWGAPGEAHGGLHRLGRQGLGNRRVPVIRREAVGAMETKPLKETADGRARQAQ